MRTNIEIDDKLMAEVLQGFRSDRGFDPFVAHLGLRSAMAQG